MIRAFCVLGIAAVSVGFVAGPAAAQERKKEAAPPAQEMTLPKPGPEHELLKKEAGVWDAEVEMTDPTTGKTETSKGVETNTLLGGGLWVISDFKSQMFGAPFQGHGITGYDPAKKKYVGTWVDSMSSTLSPVEGTYDPKTHTSTSWMEGMGPDGKIAKMKMIVEWKDDNTRVFTMHAPGEPGKEIPVMKISYKRRSPAPSR